MSIQPGTISAPASPPLLGAIRAVTYSVPDLDAIEQAYRTRLGYLLLGRRRVSDAEARSWAAPAAAGRPMLTLAPASGEPVFLRFIEDAEAGGWTALTTFGWNATEFVVQDVEALAARLAHSEFRIIGPPKPLTRFPMIRAMQALGPAGECCYFTQIGPGSGLDLAPARSFVGRVFIAVIAGPDADALYAPYALFGNRTDPPVATPIGIISRAHSLPEETPHRHGLVRLSGGTLIELDQYPASARRRDSSADGLPPGMAIVTLDADSLAALPRIGAASECPLPGLRGSCACLRGAAGELIEIFAGTPSTPLG